MTNAEIVTQATEDLAEATNQENIEEAKVILCQLKSAKGLVSKLEAQLAKVGADE